MIVVRHLDVAARSRRVKQRTYASSSIFDLVKRISGPSDRSTFGSSQTTNHFFRYDTSVLTGSPFPADRHYLHHKGVVRLHFTAVLNFDSNCKFTDLVYTCIYADVWDLASSQVRSLGSQVWGVAAGVWLFSGLEVQVHHLISLGGWNDVIHLSIYQEPKSLSTKAMSVHHVCPLYRKLKWVSLSAQSGPRCFQVHSPAVAAPTGRTPCNSCTALSSRGRTALFRSQTFPTHS
jgi:hypothetical protein